MSSDQSASGAPFGEEGEMGEVIVSNDGVGIQAVVKHERVCGVDDSYQQVVLSIAVGELQLRVPFEQKQAADLGQLLTQAGSAD